jgi:nucleoside-diphosphate-sugar epimerase
MAPSTATATRGLITVFGYGPTGEATVDRLSGRGQAVRVVQRKRPDNLPAGVEFVAGDILKVEDVKRALSGAAQAVVTTGFDYRGKSWKVMWPTAMRNLLAAAEAANVRIVQVDNLYMYGPQDEPLHEDMALTSYGVKPAVRAEVTRMWQTAARAGKVRWAALRAPDFYGPGVRNSHLGDTGLVQVAAGKTAQVLMSPDLPHAVAYVPDIGRAVVSLLDAGDDAYGQAWHVPCAPAKTPRQVLQMGADVAGVKLKVMAMPGWMLQAMGVVAPMMRELSEMRFTWNRPYHVDATKFARRFWSDATPLEVGIPATIRSYPGPAVKPATSKTSRGQTPATSATP